MRKFILFFIFLSIATCSLNAQILPNWTWAKALGGSMGMQVQDVLMDNAGNMYVSAMANAGPTYFDGSVFSTQTHQSIFISKFSSSGNLLWKVLVVKKDSFAYSSLSLGSMKLDRNNNLYFTFGTNGCSGGNDTFYTTLFANVQKDIALIGLGCGEEPRKAIIKLDPDGNLKYVSTMEGYGQAGKRKGAGGSLAINSSIVDSLGNLYLAGSFMLDSLKFLNFTVHGAALYQNSFVAKIDTIGNFVWFTSDSTSSPQYNGSEANSLIIDASGNPLIFGDFTSVDRKFGSFTINNTGSQSNLYFVSLDTKDGTPLLLTSYGSDRADYAGSISSDSKGNYYVTGFTSSSSVFGYSTSGTGYYETFLANIDGAANVNWAKVINTELPNYGSASTLKLVMGPDNAPVLTGLFQGKTLSAGSFIVQNHDTSAIPSYADFYSIKFIPNDTAVFLRSFGSAYYDNDFNVFADSHNMLTVIASITDTLFYIGKDTLKFPAPPGGFLIAHFDGSGNYLGQISFTPYSGQSFNVWPGNVVQSYSGYLGVAGGFTSSILYIGNNTLSTQDSLSLNDIFISKMAYSLSGTIYDQANLRVSRGYVNLLMLSQDGPALLIESTSIGEAGSYSFSDAPLSGTIVYAAADTSIYHYYVGTYAGNSMLWTGAAILDLVTTPPATFNITLKQVLPITGPGSISGTLTNILADTGKIILKFTGRPMKGASVVLIGKSTKGTDTIIAVTFTDEMGYYHFDKVPVGSYIVWVDFPGLGMKEYWTVSISDIAPSIENVDYIVSDEGIFKDLSAAIKTNKQVNNTFLVYPNPATDYIHAIIPMNGATGARLDIYNVNGQLLNSIILESSTESNVFINTAGLPSGIYILKASILDKTPIYGRFIRQ
jgi:hypothetical protein